MVGGVQHRVKTAIKRKRTRVLKLYAERSPIGFQKYIDTPGPRGVERIVAYDGMVVRVLVEMIAAISGVCPRGST